ncbi:MAG TPA: hypothetical protein VHM90_19290, partial [Phycisphaerae bacterium]|nr:hypothetical protein [Phycisphaerae bacterium]
YALEIDEDSEPQVFRAVEQLTGRSAESLKEQWSALVATNPERSGMEQVSPIIRIWLKKVRDRLDMQYLQGARLLHPREKEVTQFVVNDRFFTVITKAFTGQEIRGKIDSTDPEWWGGAYYAYVNTVFSKVPHDSRDRFTFLDKYDLGAAFSCEEIFVDNRHIYTVIYTGEDGSEALVWRTRNQVSSEAIGIFQAPAEPAERGKTRQWIDKLAGKDEPQAQAVETEESLLPAAHPYRVLQSEKAYVLALPRSPTLNERRREYISLLYDSDPSKYHGKMEQLLEEVDGLLRKVFKKNPPGLERERRLLQAHAVIFYDEREES